MTTHRRKSAVRPWWSVRRPSSKSCRKTFQMLLCDFSNSSRRTTENGFARTDEMSVAASYCMLESASSRSRLCSVWNSVMSSRTRRSADPKRNSASAFAISVLPVPVGPTKRNTPSGRVGSVRLALIRAMRSTRQSTASGWPSTRAVKNCRTSSRSSGASGSTTWSGRPVASESVARTCSLRTGAARSPLPATAAFRSRSRPPGAATAAR